MDALAQLSQWVPDAGQEPLLGERRMAVDSELARANGQLRERSAPCLAGDSRRPLKQIRSYFVDR